MKKIYAILTAFLLTMAAEAQTLNVKVGTVTYSFPAEQAGDMVYTESGSMLTICGKTFETDNIDEMTIDEGQLSDNSVSVNYDGASATVVVAGNIARYITVEQTGAHVSLTQDADVDDTVGEITYTLSGTSSDGEFYMTGSYKATVELNGLTLTNATPLYSGAAVCIMDGKRIDLSVKKETENTLTDCASGSQKAALYCKGHLELKGQGTLNVYGKLAHAIKSAEYMQIRKCTVNVKEAVKDGLSCDEYFLMESGTVNISGVGDDGIQCDVDGTTSTGETADHEDEDSGNIYIAGGTLNVSTTAVGSKGLNAAGTLTISESTQTATVITVKNSGGVDTSDSTDLAGSACLKADTAIVISGGTLTLTNSGQGGRAINSDGTLTVSGGTIDAKAQGTNYGSSGGGRWGGNSSTSNHKYAKGVKADGNITISGGTLNIYSKSHEGLESKGTIDISGGEVYVQASDDAINAASHLTVSGGQVCGYSTGNDGLDSNGNMYIKGGLVYAICSGSPEVGLDANTEGGYKLYLSGGTVIAIGGLENGSSLTQSCYQASSWNKNTWYALTVGSSVFAFKTPSSGGSGIVVSGASQPTLKSGVTVSGGTTIFSGMGNVNPTVSGGSSVSLSSYSGNSGGPGGGPGGGGWPGGWH